MAARDHPLLGKWRIVETALWDSDFLDLVEPAYIRFDAQGRGEFVFGAVQASLHCRSARTGSSRARSASTTATSPPSRRADGDTVEVHSAPRERPSSSPDVNATRSDVW